MGKIRMLLAEDEDTLAMIIKESLETRNFDILVANDGEMALQHFLNRKFDVAVLDIMMPKKDGISLVKEIRKVNKDIPIIFLTAKSQVQDVIEGFQVGANDYIKKPFSMEELIIRIEALLGRLTKSVQNDVKNIGSYEFDFVKQTLSRRDEHYNLTHREAELLKMLNNNLNDVVERSLILNKIWGKDDFFNGRSLDVFITKLRKKLSNDPSVQIVNVRGFGYKLIC